MTVSDDELIARLEAACNGHPHAEIPWPHRLLHDAIARLRSLSESKRELEEALERQADNMAFVLNHMSVPDQFYVKFTRELAEDRAVIAKEAGHAE